MKRYLTIVAIQVGSILFGAVLGYVWGGRLESGPFLEIIWPYLIMAGASVGWLLGLILGGIYFWRVDHR